MATEGEGRLKLDRPVAKRGELHVASRNDATIAWAHIMKALATSDVASDRRLADDIGKFVMQSPHWKDVIRHRQRRAATIARHAIVRAPRPAVARVRPDPEIER